jgi:peptide/nickel transport system substrate-binding protein
MRFYLIGAERFRPDWLNLVEDAFSKAILIADELPALPLYYPVYTYGVSDTVYNVQMGSINQPSERFKTFADWYMVTKRVPANQAADLAPPTPPGATPVSE